MGQTVACCFAWSACWSCPSRLCWSLTPAGCFRRYLLNSIEWLDDALDNFGEDDYLLIDCPGQIELYSHLPVMRTLAAHLQKKGFKAVGVYLMDALFVTDHAKMLAGNLAALSAMVAMELPHVNVRPLRVCQATSPCL